MTNEVPADDEEAVFAGWTCDELVPDLCDLGAPVEGHITLRGMKVRYWRYKPSGRAPEGSDNYPLIVIHGGPAQSHDYMLSLKQHACRGRETIFYDQAGSGASDWPSFDADIRTQYSWLLDANYYTREELPALIKHLKLEKYHLLGHSWGTLIAQLYALNASPKGLVSMILAGPISDPVLYNEAQMDPETGTVTQLPPFIRDRMMTLERAGMHDSDEYLAIDGLFSIIFTSWTIGTRTIPDCIRETFEKTNWFLYDLIWGPSEIHIDERSTIYKLKTTDRLKYIDVPVLVTSAKYDLITPRVVQPFIDNLPYAEYLMFNRSSHASMVDQPGASNDAIADFLGRIEADGIAGVKPKAEPFPDYAENDTTDTGAPNQICVKFDFDSGEHTVSTVLMVAALLGSFLFGAICGSASSSKKQSTKLKAA